MSSFSHRLGVLPRIGEALPRYMPFPLLQAAVNEVENNIKAPRPLNLFAAFAAMAIPIQGLFDVCKPTGQVVPTSLMMMSIADSGERKSTVENIFFKAIRDFQKQRNSAYQADIKTWESKIKIWDIKSKVIINAIGKLSAVDACSDEEERRLMEHDLARPVKPKQFKMLYEDTTSEALFFGLHQNLLTAGLTSSEGGGLLNGRALNDFSKLNSIWSNDSILVERKTAASFELAGARLSTSIMVQERAFCEYMIRCGEKSRGSGLWARFLVCYPASTQSTRIIKNVTMSWEHCGKFSARMHELLTQNVILLTEPSRLRQIINLSPEASELWVDIFNDIELEIKSDGRFYELGDHASKLADNICRVAALIHVFEGFPGDISSDTLWYSVRFCLWCSDEFARIFLPPNQEEMDAAELDEWLWRYRDKGDRWIAKNYILQHCPNKLREKNRLNRALEKLCDDRKLAPFVDGKKHFFDFLPRTHS